MSVWTVSSAIGGQVVLVQTDCKKVIHVGLKGKTNLVLKSLT